MLSMVETAVELTQGRIAGIEIRRILELGRAMLEAPVQLIDGAAETLSVLADSRDLMLITKGDLLDQESKLERSGLRDLFTRVEVVSRKDAAVYRRILDRHGIPLDRFLMVGDSLRSDVMPVLELGGAAVHIPPETPWAHEVVELDPALQSRYVRIDRIASLLDILNVMPRGA
jgi:putative hydrolase of the HAD superfamily